MTQCADNFSFDITAWRGHYDRRDFLQECVAIAMGDQKTVERFTTDGHSITFYWGNRDGTPLPTPLDRTALAVMIAHWLGNAEYPPEPDIDGSVSKGWRILNTDRPSFYAVLTVKPAWLEHHK